MSDLIKRYDDNEDVPERLYTKLISDLRMALLSASAEGRKSLCLLHAVVRAPGWSSDPDERLLTEIIKEIDDYLCSDSASTRQNGSQEQINGVKTLLRAAALNKLALLDAPLIGESDQSGQCQHEWHRSRFVTAPCPECKFDPAEAAQERKDAIARTNDRLDKI